MTGEETLDINTSRRSRGDVPSIARKARQVGNDFEVIGPQHSRTFSTTTRRLVFLRMSLQKARWGFRVMLNAADAGFEGTQAHGSDSPCSHTVGSPRAGPNYVDNLVFVHGIEQRPE